MFSRHNFLLLQFVMDGANTMDRAKKNIFVFDSILFSTLQDNKARNMINLVSNENYITFTYFGEKSGNIFSNTTLHYTLVYFGS